MSDSTARRTPVIRKPKTDRSADSLDEETRKITLSEVAAYLGVGRRVVSRLVKGGQLKIYKDPLDDRRKLISVKQLDQLRRESKGRS